MASLVELEILNKCVLNSPLQVYSVITNIYFIYGLTVLFAFQI